MGNSLVLVTPFVHLTQDCQLRVTVTVIRAEVKSYHLYHQTSTVRCFNLLEGPEWLEQPNLMGNI